MQREFPMNPQRWEVIGLSLSNLTSLVSLIIKLWPECEFETEYEFYLRALENDQYTAFLAKTDEGKFVGFAVASIRAEHVEGASSSPVGYLEGLYVEPDLRRRHIASELNRKAELWCRNKGCKEMASDTEINNAGSHSFHLQNGYREQNRIICYLKDL